MSRAVVAAYAACALIWGTTWFAIRVCIAPGGYPTYLALALRFAIASSILLPLAARARPWPKGRAWIYLVVAGLLDAGAYLFVYLGEERVSGGIGAVVYGMQPLILALILSATRIKGIEKLTREHVIGAVVSLAGVGVLFLDRLDVSARQGVGVLFILASVVVATIYSTIMKRQGGHVPNVVATAIFLGVTAIVVGVVAIVAHEPFTMPGLPPTLALVYLGIVGSVVAFLVYFWLLGATSLQFTSTLVFVYPLVALATDAMFERAISLGVRAYIGAGITLAGLAVSLRRRPA